MQPVGAVSISSSPECWGYILSKRVIEDIIKSISNTMGSKDLDENNSRHEKLYLCVHRFVRVPMSLVYSCYRGKPKVWNVYPANKEQELRSKSCKSFPLIVFDRITMNFIQG